MKRKFLMPHISNLVGDLVARGMIEIYLRSLYSNNKQTTLTNSYTTPWRREAIYIYQIVLTALKIIVQGSFSEPKTLVCYCTHQSILHTKRRHDA